MLSDYCAKFKTLYKTRAWSGVRQSLGGSDKCCRCWQSVRWRDFVAPALQRVTDAQYVIETGSREHPTKCHESPDSAG